MHNLDMCELLQQAWQQTAHFTRSVMWKVNWVVHRGADHVKQTRPVFRTSRPRCTAEDCLDVVDVQRVVASEGPIRIDCRWIDLARRVDPEIQISPRLRETRHAHQRL